MRVCVCVQFSWQLQRRDRRKMAFPGPPHQMRPGGGMVPPPGMFHPHVPFGHPRPPPMMMMPPPPGVMPPGMHSG